MLANARTTTARLGGHTTAESAAATRGRATGRSGGVNGNERLTSSLALLLIALLPIEAATTIALGTLLPIHIALGLALVPLLGLKIATTSWRMLRYYLRSEKYVRKGPPALLLRLLAPVLVLSTTSLFGSGVALVLGGAPGGFLLTVHVTSFVIWGIAVLAHILWYGLRAVRLGTRDWRRPDRLLGVGARRAVLLGGVALGIVAAIVLYPG